MKLPNARLPNAIVFLRNCLFFYLFLFNLFLFKRFDQYMLEVVLTSFFFFIILAEVALDTIVLLHQLVFYTNTLFGTLKIDYVYGRVVISFDFGSDGREFDSHHRRSYFSVPHIFFLITMFVIFFPS